MRYELRPFRAAHFQELLPQHAQLGDLQGWDGTELERGGHGWSGFRQDPGGWTLLGFAALIPFWRGRAYCATMLSIHVGPCDMLWIHRQARAGIEAGLRVFHRIECTVLQGFEAGVRWAEMLGFAREGLMRCYDPQGNDHWLYARTRPP